ncbi:MAG: ABC transporter substrate-binding protein [Deltaproteobacteria bacterium]|nr:ABC transporter substrate-binding protein [Deltaproteobacteria bacterium]
MKKRWGVEKAAALLAVSVAWIAFVLTPAAEVCAAQPYKVGAVFSVSGRASFLGDPEKKTVLMLQEQINKQGGINGHPLEVVIYDDEGDSTKCALAVRKLIMQDKVCAIVGPSLSGLSLAVLPEAQKHKVPMVSCAASYKIVTKNPETGEQWKWIFKTPQSDSMAVEAIYTHMKKHGISKIAILSVTTGFGASGRGELLRLAPKYGITVVADEKYGPKDTDMTAQLTKIKGHAPQAIVNWSIGPTQVVVLRNWKALGMNNIPMYQSHGFGSGENIKLAAGAAEGVYCPLGACVVADALPADHPQKKVATAYAAAYKAKYGTPISTFGGHAWDAFSLVVKALDAVGCDCTRIRDTLENIKGFVGQHGVFNFSPKDHNGLTMKDAFQMMVVKNGCWKVTQ